MILKDYYTLSNGVNIPKIGFGTWQIPPGDVTYHAVKEAIEVGYIHIDTAYVYQNEESVGLAIKDSSLKREDLFITTKLPSHIKTYEGAEDFFNQSIDRLKTPYIDLFLIHAPWPWSEIGKDCKDGNALAFKKMIELYDQKRIRSIGVSNFNFDDLKDLIDQTGFVPHVNQISFFAGIHNKQKETLAFCKKHNILVEAYSPLAIGHALKLPLVIELAQKYHKTPAQILIRYTLEHGTLPLPKSIKKDRMIENTAVDFTIDQLDVLRLDALSEDPRKF
jgi:diketogulonate reductase-like aldo/keto reductase